ncbi:MAG: hypothetical protein C5B50_23065 [Verrucomicrobia bacterium]|nr:MAG: hypothetical protein C5B50_23065 [Verrucomicrobiota bacterium]
MNCSHDDEEGVQAQESHLIRLYMELTGACESVARGVFMHVCCREKRQNPAPGMWNQYASFADQANTTSQVMHETDQYRAIGENRISGEPSALDLGGTALPVTI